MTEAEPVTRVGLKARLFHLLLRLFRVEPRVQFTDVRLLAAGVTPPPFDTQIGEYERPDVCMSGSGRVSSGSLPGSLDCPAEFVIYASYGGWLLTCDGFGPDHAVVTKARQIAEDTAAGLVCASGCVKSVEEIWRGWACDFWWLPNFASFIGQAAVEIKVSCTSS